MLSSWRTKSYIMVKTTVGIIKNAFTPPELVNGVPRGLSGWEFQVVDVQDWIDSEDDVPQA